MNHHSTNHIAPPATCAERCSIMFTYLAETLLLTKSQHEAQMRRFAAEVCEVEAMCFHNLPKPVAVHKTLESIFSPDLHMAQFKKHANPTQAESHRRSSR